MRTRLKSRAVLTVASVLLAIGLAGLVFALAKGTAKAPVATLPAPLPGTSTVTGDFACLPHRDPSGPQTMECAYGIRAQEGYYALDTGKIYGSAAELPAAKRYVVEGAITPASGTERYDIVGTIVATKVTPLAQ